MARFVAGLRYPRQWLKSQLQGRRDSWPASLRAAAAITGQLQRDEAQLLYTLAKQVRAGCILEVGSYRGRSTVALGLGSIAGGQAPVYAIEPHEPFIGVLGGTFGAEDRAHFYRSMLFSGCYKAVRLINLSSEIVAPGWQRPVSLLWIDGDHSYAAVRRDLTCWEPHLLPQALVAFHDSLDATLGPAQLIQELLDAGTYARFQQVGLTTVLQKR